MENKSILSWMKGDPEVSVKTQKDKKKSKKILPSDGIYTINHFQKCRNTSFINHPKKHLCLNKTGSGWRLEQMGTYMSGTSYNCIRYSPLLHL